MTKWSKAELPSRSEQRFAKKSALIREAAHAFRTKGFYATSMEDIATALGVTKGALYRYVENKQEILFECFKSSNQLGEAALELARWHSGTGLEKLRTFVEFFVEKYIEENTAGGAMVDIGALFPEQRAEIIAGRDRVDAGLRTIVSHGVEDGSIVSRDVKLTVFTIMGSINWIPSWYSPGGQHGPKEIAGIIADIFSGGLQPRQDSQQAIAVSAAVPGASRRRKSVAP
ncbi:TetR family transcriptional regulator [Variovorax sp. WS11]|uniref:TetR/AcrR family transcriptional regulator n=1 Tax=Variovorax sp. WS11 TaxID=1105204 RepID=UPI000D0DE6E2|nr:TetR/AcrR family transcriptional regulator [Variovorax sp. WS11]NDZ17578.1 TetR/AcrR family transcriptional regulator [Variovorax sp. WS11]PSL82217.1 TetR family transcriptional regulator [Variovorax sp. WS11]